MKLETVILIYSMINNLIIATAKIIGGFILNLSSLFADGLHTFCDFITDIICMLGAKISKKKPTKHHPFGFGKIEYLTNLFVGIILFLLGIYIIVHSITAKTIIPPASLLWLLFIALILKLIAIMIMHIAGEKKHSQLLITSVEESKTDLYSSIGVIIITIVLQFSTKYPFLKHIDMIGTILIGLMVIKTSLEIIVQNSLSLIGEVEDNKDIINKIKKHLEAYKEIEDQEITLIKYGSYYKLNLELDLNYKMSLRKITNLENKIRKDFIRHRSFNIKYVSIYVTNKLD